MNAVCKLIALIPLAAVLLLTGVTTGAAADGYWFDLLTEDSDRAQPFYASLFGWQFKYRVDGYWLIETEGQVIGGMVQIDDGTSGVNESLWLAAVPVDQLDTAVKTALEQGATLHQNPDSAPGLGRYAVVIDPQGAPVTLREQPETAPTGAHAVPGDWRWIELWTDRPETAAGFYTQVALMTSSDDNAEYRQFKLQGKAWGGYLEMPFEGGRPIWMPYIQVVSLKPFLEKAKRAGGQILLEPSPNIHDGQVALLTDPTGAAFLVTDAGEGGAQ